MGAIELLSASTVAWVLCERFWVWVTVILRDWCWVWEKGSLVWVVWMWMIWLGGLWVGVLVSVREICVRDIWTSDIKWHLVKKPCVSDMSVKDSEGYEFCVWEVVGGRGSGGMQALKTKISTIERRGRNYSSSKGVQKASKFRFPRSWWLAIEPFSNFEKDLVWLASDHQAKICRRHLNHLNCAWDLASKTSRKLGLHFFLYFGKVIVTEICPLYDFQARQGSPFPWLACKRPSRTFEI